MANVPNSPGVPSLGSYSAAIGTFNILSADAANIASMFSGSLWGLYTLGGTPAFSPISIPIIGALVGDLTGNDAIVLGVQLMENVALATAPQEAGAFISYNRVQMPYMARVRYFVAGSVSWRSAFLSAVIAAKSSTTLYNLITPEMVYRNCNVTHYERETVTRGPVTALNVEVWAEQVREGTTAAFSATTNPSDAASQSGGTVQSTPPTDAQSGSVPPGGPL